MDLSIVVVNYNVKHFLEQCLYSVYKAVKNIDAEIFVVDNNSVDGSCTMVKEKFPEVHLIENKENLGFSTANNQAIKISKGRYVLLLNPDTFVQEDTLEKCLKFSDEHPDMGGLGVKMIDGKGDFLPESKRSLPTPAVSFYKIFGLASLFPKSKTFGKYHLGFLDNDKTHKVDVLAGAYMFLRKSVLDEIGLLDEAFFMYGEDIDLSYRITKAGYSNYYYPDTPIIHYKGESTKKGSINYVMVFYNAMIIFARKHFTSKNARLYSFLIHMAIYFRAALGIVRRVVLTIFEPLLDLVVMFLGFYFLTPHWEMYQYDTLNYYPKEFLQYVIPSYILLWMFFVYFAGGYEKRIKPFNLAKGVVWGTLFIIFVYALLPESLRYSRILILLGSVWTFLTVFLNRLLGGLVFKDNRKLIFKTAIKRIATIGSEEESERVMSILSNLGLKYSFVGRVEENENGEGGHNVIGTINQLSEIVKVNKIEELIFCSKDISAASIIETMLLSTSPITEFKIAPPESISVIGSNSIHTAGDLYVVDLNALSKGVNKRKKRLFDILSSLLLLMLSPVAIFFMVSPGSFLKNCVLVALGKISWVGVSFEGHGDAKKEELKRGVLSPIDGLDKREKTESVSQRVSIMYANDYKIINDLRILLKAFRQLGRKVNMS